MALFLIRVPANYLRIGRVALIVISNLVVFKVLAQSRKDSIDVFIHQQMRERHIPGLQLAILRNGQIDHLSAYGLANIEHNIKTTNQSVFSINSITKAFVGVAIMQLAEQGKLRIDTPIAQYMDSLPTAWQSLTITAITD